MYGRLFISLYQGANPVVFAQDVCLFCLKSNAIARISISRAVVPWGCKALGTSAVHCSESKDRPPSIEEGERKDGERTRGQGKSEKESLLDLLGGMKVEVTSKRKIQAQRGLRSSEPARPGPEALESTISMFQKAKAGTQRETLSPELVAAATAAASSMPDRSQAESELLQQLRRHEAISETQKKGDGNAIGNIIADMKVGRQPTGRQYNRPVSQIRFDDDGGGFTHDGTASSELDGVRKRKGLFTGKRLNIFTVDSENAGSDGMEVPSLSLWDLELANQIVAATHQNPRNGFEEMIEWTKEGKLWQYPIDNEAGLEKEANVAFHEHVFLDRHLEEGFPQQGPVRHFMELVVAGLAKNPYLTVQQKTEHIAWFRDYFQKKKDVLREAEAYLN